MYSYFLLACQIILLYGIIIFSVIMKGFIGEVNEEKGKKEED